MAERAAFLREACGGDMTLLGRVERLLAAHERGAAFMAAPTGAPRAEQSNTGLTEGTGATIGRYTLLSLLGEGGFGSVFMAEQREPLTRRVALKVIKLGMDTRQVIARFEAERQALAMMDHPGIAKVLDAGATDSGRPYFVMELVQGEPITTFCDRSALDLRDRLALFQQVCHAVQHAHQKGIIHRDLKPSNVLVADSDGRPTPKIIDFGIAKATDRTSRLLTETQLVTDFRQFLGTPEYMSPEQAGLGGADIDTRSDIYSLGVLLYELLTGGPPFDPKRLRSAAWEEMRRIIREDEPERPSTRLYSLETTREVAAHRRTEPARLIGLLRGDLDWIVMKCLEKDRARRYETANALAVDIGRHVAGEPVLAVPPSRSYLLRKFLRRHRAQTVAAGLIGASLLAAVIGTTTFAVREARQRALAERRAEETNRVANFQAEMLASIDVPSMGLRQRDDLLAQAAEGWRGAGLSGNEVSQRSDELESLLADTNFTSTALLTLDRSIFEGALTAIDHQYADEPLLRARLLHTLAGTLRRLGLFERATAPQREALEIRLKLLSADHPDTLSSLNEMGRTLVLRFKPDEAEPYLRAAREGRRRVLGHDHADTLSSTYLLGYALQRQSRFVEAEGLQREALDGRRRTLGDDDPATLDSIWRMGQLLLSQNRVADAGPYALEALEGARRTLGADNHRTLLATGTLANVRQHQGRIEEAERLWREALEGSRRVLGEDHRDTLFFRCKVGSMLLKRGELDEADAYLRDLLARRLRILGPDHPDTVESQRVMAALRRRQDRLDEAESLYRDTLAAFRRVQGPAHRETLDCAGQLASLLEQTGRTEEADDLRRGYVREALSAFSSWQGEGEYPGLRDEFYALLREINDNVVLQREYVGAHRAKYGEQDARTLSAANVLAQHLAVASDPAASDPPLVEDAIESVRKP